MRLLYSVLMQVFVAICLAVSPADLVSSTRPTPCYTYLRMYDDGQLIAMGCAELKYPNITGL